MKVIPIGKSENKNAIQFLEETIDKVRAGTITAVAISWVESDNSIGGDVSNGGNQILMWAAMEHAAKSFYLDQVREE